LSKISGGSSSFDSDVGEINPLTGNEIVRAVEEGPEGILVNGSNNSTSLPPDHSRA
jgi:hypothetical protein